MPPSSCSTMPMSRRPRRWRCRPSSATPARCAPRRAASSSPAPPPHHSHPPPPPPLFAPRPVLEALEHAVTQRTLQLKVGDGRSPGVGMGPLATERQRARSERLVADALAQGARLLGGGRRPPGLECGYFYEPTVLAGVPDTAAILHEEPFAPVMAIVPVADADEAV